jgi:hypothetical protein
MTRGRAAVLLAVTVVVLLGGSLTLTAAAAPSTVRATAQPTQSTRTIQPAATSPDSVPLPIPIEPVTPVPCFPGSIAPECLNQSAIPTPAPPSAPATPPCTGEGCIPQPSTATPQPAPPSDAPSGNSGTGDGTGGDSCGLFDITGCVGNSIDNFFQSIVTAALNPLLDLLGHTLLTTPTPDSLPAIGQLWNSSWQIMLACYGLLILIGGILVMAYGTVQNRHSVKEIAPRIVLGFLAGALSLWVASQAIDLANALAQAIVSGGVDPVSAGNALKTIVMHDVAGGLFFILLGLVLAVLLIVLLVTYIVRVAVTVILIAGAPLALMAHALPQTEGIARWWWKAFGGCLAIQIGQSLTLITAIRVFLAPGGFQFFGPTTNGLVNILVSMALVYVLFKIPFWFLGSLRGGGGGRSLIGSLVRGVLAYKTFGLLSGRGGGAGRRPRPAKGSARGSNSGGDGTSNPYVHTRTTSGGQYALPLTGLRRGKAPKPPHQRYPARGTTASFGPRSAPSGTQLSLPLGDDWPENKPVLGRDGQYRLPLNVQRVTPPPSPQTGAPAPGTRGQRGGQQMELPFDPYRGNRPTRSGQYPLPLGGVRRVPKPTAPAPATPPPAAPAAGGHGRQMPLPFDPYQGNRPTRSGQYRLPLEGLHRAPAHTPPPAAPTPPPTRAARPAGQQLRLPLDLPKPTRRTPPPTPSAAPAPRPQPHQGGKK